MSLPPVVSDITVVVLRGNFRPVNISPAWLREQELIGNPEQEEANFELLIPNEAAVFTAGWLRCQATSELLQFQTEQQEEVERLRDLAAGTLRAIDEKPISALGINRNVHFATSNPAQWHMIGDNVVRNDIWEGVLDLPGMRSVTYWGARSDGYAGRVQVQIEPSALTPLGVYVAYNDHYDLTRVEAPPTTREESFEANRKESTEATLEKIPVAIEVLNSEWEISFQRSTAILERIWEQAVS